MSARTVAVLTGGGDCPGLNAVIRGVVRTAVLRHGWNVLGIEDGFDGLVDGPRVRLLGLDDVRGILPRGGTILGTSNRGNPFLYPVEVDGKTIQMDISDKVVEQFRQLDVNALIAIGIRNPNMMDKALAVAAVIGKVEIDHGKTSCKTPFAPDYIERTVARKKSRGQWR